MDRIELYYDEKDTEVYVLKLFTDGVEGTALLNSGIYSISGDYLQERAIDEIVMSQLSAELP